VNAPGYIVLGGRSYFCRVGADGLKVEGWHVSRLAVRTYRFTRVRWGKTESFVHTFEAPVAPPPVMPRLARRVSAKRLNQESA
jgi:hypothetical protein